MYLLFVKDRKSGTWSYLEKVEDHCIFLCDDKEKASTYSTELHARCDACYLPLGMEWKITKK